MIFPKKDVLRSRAAYPAYPSLRAEAAREQSPATATSTIAAVATALPPHRYGQEELIAAAEAVWKDQARLASRLAPLYRRVLVGSRSLALPVERYAALTGFGEANREFGRVATDLGEQALRRALDDAGLAPRDVDHIFSTTVTGLMVPSLDARLVNRLGLRPDVRRTPLFGLGCLAGAAGIARMHDYLAGHPDDVAVLVSVELCSLTLQRGDLSVANLIASGLFGDGAAAVVGVGARRARRLGLAARPKVVATASSFYPDTEDVMGWDIGDGGFKIVLSAEVPEVVRSHIGRDVDGFLATRGLARRDVERWICHPGGPKVLEAMQEALGVGERELALTWRSLREVGNLSSASVLFVLKDTLLEAAPEPGAHGLLLAMGPGFCSEAVLLEW